VDAAALETMSTRISGVGSSTASVHGSLGKAAGAAAGCQEPAAGAFNLLQNFLVGALSCLDDCSTSLSGATSDASVSYVTTDATQMPLSVNACPAGP
jgi:hypothetical protein